MSDSIDKSIKTLQNPDAGWVNRRDAANHLARSAREALGALHEFKNDPDRDVQRAILESLNSIGIDAPMPVEDATSLAKLVNALESKNSREVSKTKDGFEVLVRTKGDRSQRVSVIKTVSNTKKDIIQVSTTCGPATESVHEWALKNNMNMSHCSLAIEERDGETWFVLVNNHLTESITFEELKLTVKEVAFYGDWVEEKITGEDMH